MLQGLNARTTADDVTSVMDNLADVCYFCDVLETDVINILNAFDTFYFLGPHNRLLIYAEKKVTGIKQ